MIPVACYRLASSNLTVIAGYFPLPGQIKQPQTDSSILGGISLPLSVRIMAYPLTWLTLITIATGTYLMNGYELFKVLPTFPYTKKQAKDYLFHLFPQSQAIFLPVTLKVFSVFSLLLSLTLLWPGKNSLPSLQSAHKSVRQNSKGLICVSGFPVAWIWQYAVPPGQSSGSPHSLRTLLPVRNAGAE